MPGESDFHHWLQSRTRPSRRVPVPIGDDLAVLAAGGDRVVVGADQVLEGVHFDLADTSPEAVGQKAVNRNFSDVAAMACWPTGLVVTLALPRDGRGLAEALFRGIERAGTSFDCPVVGGDTASWDAPIAISVTVLAEPVGGRIVTRQGARPGDGLFVTGPLGGSLASGRHLTFTPRIREARRLVRRWDIHAMIDLSDGLSRDVPRLVEHADLVADRIPVNAGSDFAGAVGDGEDYELLFAAPVCEDAVRIGTVNAAGGLTLDGQPLPTGGWEHAL